MMPTQSGLELARLEARAAALRYRRHVLELCRAECTRGGVCRIARGLDLDASAAHWRLERLLRL